MKTPKNTGNDLFDSTPPGSRSIRVGIGGWTFAPWRNNFYPEGWVQRRELEYASRHLATIEINGTFYGAQKPAVYAKWRSETPAGFVFSLKAPGRIVESKSLAGVGKQIEAFVFGGLAELGDRLGPILWQFAPYRRFDADEFAAFLDLLPDALDGRPLRHVLEVRNESFRSDAYVELARQLNRPTVFTDSPDYPSFADITGDFVYARLMRSAADIPTGYAPAELNAWATRARQWAEGGTPEDLPHVQKTAAAKKPRDVFIYFISAAKERNPAAAMALQERIDKRA
jgi:uncharacterized protein YecE (DUF72 family)